MRNYDWWEHGIWIGDGHNWNLDMDVPREKRIPIGETVVLQPPRFALKEVPPLTCEIYKLEKCELYIAIGHYKGVPVLFYDKNSYSEEYKRRYDKQLTEEYWNIK